MDRAPDNGVNVPVGVDVRVKSGGNSVGVAVDVMVGDGVWLGVDVIDGVHVGSVMPVSVQVIDAPTVAGRKLDPKLPSMSEPKAGSCKILSSLSENAPSARHCMLNEVVCPRNGTGAPNVTQPAPPPITVSPGVMAAAGFSKAPAQLFIVVAEVFSATERAKNRPAVGNSISH